MMVSVQHIHTKSQSFPNLKSHSLGQTGQKKRGEAAAENGFGAAHCKVNRPVDGLPLPALSPPSHHQVPLALSLPLNEMDTD